ncbi:MAG: deoxyguanosinetriphosphate triphosphohydrolase [Chloroflexi bacterium]|nr:deoxyguanosinetriphosphate triphosphohydrolase [Chloroflexota bacterium]
MIFTRDILEDLEDRNLAPYGIRSRNSRGRIYPDDEPGYRTSFQRDRDRILHTTAFRRLEYKTQVFVNHEGDYYRTRLTHTLEVAQIGRTLARSLGANEDLVETVCLAHDMGHPPFGHSGEDSLNRLMKEHGGFDHNRQTLRIVTALEERYSEFPGLNLTYEVREGIVKHETEYDISDAQDYEPGKCGSLEAQIANAADELAYTAHDLDDGLRSGLITPQMLVEIELWRDLRQSIGWEEGDYSEIIRHRIIRRMIGIFVSDQLHTTSQRLLDANAQSPEDVQTLSYNVVGHSAEMARKNREMKDFLFANVYRHFRVVRMAVKADRIITDLFNAFVTYPDQLPLNTQQRLKSNQDFYRVVCDYIAGMTDRYALDEHERLYAPNVRT